MPDVFDGLAENVLQNVEAVNVAPGAGKYDNSKLHPDKPLSNSVTMALTSRPSARPLSFGMT